MYFDLFIPFPIPDDAQSGNKKSKGKGKAQPQYIVVRKSCWEGIDEVEKQEFSAKLALAGHLGYNVSAATITRDPEGHAFPSPFITLPFPHLDPRLASTSNNKAREANGLAGPSSQPSMVQVRRYHCKIEDGKSHPFTSANTNVLKEYDILSCQPTSEKSLQLVCTDLANPGPNQISLITLPLHEKPYHFRLNRKQIKQAQRNGVMLEVLYSAALFPPASLPSEIARRYRQNWMTNARELVRITAGKGIVMSSGSGSPDSLRGPADIINMITMLGVSANIAKEWVVDNPKRVLLRAQARKTFKGVISMPNLVAPKKGHEGLDEGKDEETIRIENKHSQELGEKRKLPGGLEKTEKRSRKA